MIDINSFSVIICKPTNKKLLKLQFILAKCLYFTYQQKAAGQFKYICANAFYIIKVQLFVSHEKWDSNDFLVAFFNLCNLEFILNLNITFLESILQLQMIF